MKRRFLATLLAGSMIISSLTGCQKTADQTKGGYHIGCIESSKRRRYIKPGAGGTGGRIQG